MKINKKKTQKRNGVTKYNEIIIKPRPKSMATEYCDMNSAEQKGPNILQRPIFSSKPRDRTPTSN